MKTAKLFKNGESQAVRLPKARSWETLIESLAKFPADFMETREQPADIDRRELLQ